MTGAARFALAVLVVAAMVSCVNLAVPPGVAVSPGDGGLPDSGELGGDGREAGRPVDAQLGSDGREAGRPVDAQLGSDGGGLDDDPTVAGKPCLHGGQCASGFCVDGVCCASECLTRCHTCRVPGSEGTCRPAPAGEDPRSECERAEPATCMQDGFCDGAGTCRRYLPGSECSPVTCSGSSEQAAGTCDGSGTCKPGTARSCAPLVCNQGSCGTACNSDAQCLTGSICESTSCRPKRPQGMECTAASQCVTGNCVEGLCCSSACNQPCHSCKLPGSLGTCTPAAAGSDPRNQCAPAAVSSCGATGECDGQGACQLQPAGTVCAGSSCAGNTETTARTCNGLGTCVAATVRACSPYLCGAGGCRTSCDGAAACQAGYTCSGQSCAATVPDPGPPPLVLDDFGDADVRSNTLGGVVTWDNQNVSLVAGEQRLVWSGSGSFHDFIEVFRSNWCEYNLNGYRKLRFRMRSSVAGKRVAVYLGIGRGGCSLDRNQLLVTVNLTTTMTSYEVDLSALVRDKALTVEFTPASTDSSQYFLDDVVLLP